MTEEKEDRVKGAPRPPRTVAGHPAPAVPLRIRHVDSLRAVAAGLVVWFHFDQTLAPLAGRDPAGLGFVHWFPHWLDIGRMGVMIFFAISGFVICRSFEGPRPGAARRFVIRRFCRLYPAYWVSLLAGLLVVWWTGEGWTWASLAANLTMGAGWLGQPRLLGVYWTLEIELLFYALCLGLFLLGWLERRMVLATLVVGLAILPRWLKIVDHHLGTHLTLTPGQPTLVLSLAVMCWGAVFRLAYDATGGFRTRVLAHGGTWLTAALGLALIDLPDPNVKWYLLGQWHGQTPGHLAVLAGLAVFAVWVAVGRVDLPWLTYLGVISYSLYLFHPLAKYALAAVLQSSPTLRGWELPLSLYLVAGTVFTMGLAGGIYRWVEHPAIALGKRWAGTKREIVGQVQP